jgi:MSHA biogenesis protein MshN
VSLINKMLQDLESRKDAQAGAASHKPVFEDLKPVKMSSPRAPSRRLPLIVLAVAVVGAGAYAWTQWGERFLSGVLPVKQQPVAMHRPQHRPATRPVPVTPPAVTAPAATPATATGVTPVPATVSAADKANEKPAMNQPAQASPPAAGQTLPAHAATAAPEKTPAPVAEAKSSSKGGYWTVARGDTLYGISTRTGVGLGDLSRWNLLGRNHVIYPGQRLRLTPPSPQSVKQASPRHDQTKTAKAVVSTAPSATGEIPTDTGVMDKKVKPPTSEERAEDEYRQAADSLQKGHEVEAKRQLRTALDDNPAHTRARELLAGLLVQSGHWHEAVQILEQGIDKVPAYYPFAQLLARVYVDHGADQKALAVMEHGRQAGAGDADYMAFLAAMYQRAGKSTEAIKAYSDAIRLNPREGRSWLGMGISLEANQDWNAAGAAYQRAIESGSLDDKLLNYARQRLAVVRNK